MARCSHSWRSCTNTAKNRLLRTLPRHTQIASNLRVFLTKHIPSATPFSSHPHHTTRTPLHRSFSSSSSSSPLHQWNSFNSAGLSYLHSSNLDAAATMFISAMRDDEAREYASKHPAVYLSLANLATVHRMQHSLRDAESEYKYAIQHLTPFLHNGLLPRDAMGHIVRGYGLTLELMGKFAQAETNYRHAYKHYQEHINNLTNYHATNQPNSQNNTNNIDPELLREFSGTQFAIGLMLEKQWENEQFDPQIKQKLAEQAKTEYEKALELAARAYEPHSANLAELRVHLAEFCAKIGDAGASQEHYLEAFNILKHSGDDARMAEVLQKYLATVCENEEEVNNIMQTLLTKKK